MKHLLCQLPCHQLVCNRETADEEHVSDVCNLCPSLVCGPRNQVMPYVRATAVTLYPTLSISEQIGQSHPSDSEASSVFICVFDLSYLHVRLMPSVQEPNPLIQVILCMPNGKLITAQTQSQICTEEILVHFHNSMGPASDLANLLRQNQGVIRFTTGCHLVNPHCPLGTLANGCQVTLHILVSMKGGMLRGSAITSEQEILARAWDAPDDVSEDNPQEYSPQVNQQAQERIKILGHLGGMPVVVDQRRSRSDNNRSKKKKTRTTETDDSWNAKLIFREKINLLSEGIIFFTPCNQVLLKPCLPIVSRS